jgi:hypothetical protein
MIIEISAVSLGLGLAKVVADIGASILNEKVRRNKEAGVATSEGTVYAAMVFNVLSFNADKVAQLWNDWGKPDGRNTRKR